MITVSDDPVDVDTALRQGELSCPGCSSRLDPWGSARPRPIRDGTESAQGVRVPALGVSFDEVLAGGDVRIEPGPTALAADRLLRYADHVFPLAPGTLHPGEDPADPAVVRDAPARQSYDLVFWRREQTELNYRRFFGVSTLAGVRVELPKV